MVDIKVMPKPDWVSWDEIHQVIYEAHAANRKKGITMHNALMTGEELKRKVGNGQCFVALDGEKLVGLTAVELKNKNKWYTQGRKTAHRMLSAIIPSYQGIGIKEDLDVLAWEWIKNNDVEVVWAGTAENNKIIRKTSKRSGFVDVEYAASRNADYYSVIFVKWLKGEPPYPLWYCNFRFKWSRFWVRLRYKPGKIERFKTIALATMVINKIKSILHK